MAKYSDIRNQLDTGDIVLFSGKGHISSAIKWFTAGKWSHVGMVIRSSEWDMLLLWESTTLSNLKTIDNAHKEGVQTVFLSERVATYDGDIGVRRLSVERTPQMIEDLKAFRAMVKDRPYEESKWELIKSALDGPSFLENQEDLSSLFCSEMVAEAYQRMGLLPDNLKSNEFTPKDFSSQRDEALPLLGGAALSEEIIVTR